ncbi:MAG: hypothetical protein PF486_04580 [Prolixibacteraceae bacterium]|jgi:mannan endo-1,4-beta-mannosidase|nr:hypothetical protein [Prolixibacteraceae bacterium]
MKKSVSVLAVLVSVLFFIACNTNKVAEESENEGFENFITVDGNQLKDGDETFRFVSYNVPTLNYNEDEFEFSRLSPYSLPNEYELRDVFETIKQTGGKVIRMYTIPARMQNAPEGTPTYVTDPGEFNEEAFETMDMVLALANEYQIRVIFSLLNNWPWMGGRPEYAAFRDKEKDEFWTDSQLIADFKKTIDFTVNRVNTVTGTSYKEDKAIMCWETGNELTSPFEWTVQITRYIKSLDSNHLILDGYHAIDDRTVREESITESSIDIVHSHHYEVDPQKFIENVERNIEKIDGRKPYMIGEFGFVGTPAIEQYINRVIDSDIVGMLIWGLRGHRRDGGFYWHSEPLGYGRYKSYHWPGFDSGEEYDERNLMALLREKAYEINGETMPPVPKPSAPELLPIEHVGKITWKGSAGASAYDLYRSESTEGDFEIVGYNLSDASQQYYPLFNDQSAEIGKTYYYKLIAKNKSGESLPSEVVGPVEVETKMLVDNMKNFGRMYYCTRGITISTANDRKFKEDMYRLNGKEGDEIIYYVPGYIKHVKINSFCQEDMTNLSFELSINGDEFEEVEASRTSYGSGAGAYGYWVPLSYQMAVNVEAQFLKVKINAETELSRLELEYR